jgi:hypothetical protein
MSKKLEKRATRLVRKAEHRATAIRRVVREYNDAAQTSSVTDPARPTEKHRQIERAVLRYNEVHKALKRIRKKIESKSKERSDSSTRSLQGR